MQWMHKWLSISLLPTARVMTLSFSWTTFTTLLFCKGVTLQQSTERQRFARSTKRSTRSDDRAMVRVCPSITREMAWVVSTLRGSSLYLLTSSRVQSRMDVHVSWRTSVQLAHYSIIFFWTKSIDNNYSIFLKMLSNVTSALRAIWWAFILKSNFSTDK